MLFIPALRWGFGLWLVGYILGFLFFAFLPPAYIGWAIMPIGIIMTVWVLLKRIKADSLRQALLVAVVWAVIAIVCDYLFLVRILKPADGYYKVDVYIYYLVTFLLPICVHFWKKKSLAK